MIVRHAPHGVHGSPESFVVQGVLVIPAYRRQAWFEIIQFDPHYHPSPTPFIG
jgi:hypothetical protein